MLLSSPGNRRPDPQRSQSLKGLRVSPVFQVRVPVTLPFLWFHISFFFFPSHKVCQPDNEIIITFWPREWRPPIRRASGTCLWSAKTSRSCPAGSRKSTGRRLFGSTSATTASGASRLLLTRPLYVLFGRIRYLDPSRSPHDVVVTALSLVSLTLAPCNLLCLATGTCRLWAVSRAWTPWCWTTTTWKTIRSSPPSHRCAHSA